MARLKTSVKRKLQSKRAITAIAAALTGVGCAGLPLGTTVRLVCGTAESIAKVLDSANASASVDGGSRIDASRD